MHPVAKKIEQVKPFANLEHALINDPNKEETLIIFYFTGESYVKNGKIETDLGVGPLPIENRILGFGQGLTNITIWAVWDCSRHTKVVDAGQ